MKKEELIEMINSTICTNGKREITKSVLICALLAIVEAL